VDLGDIRLSRPRSRHRHEDLIRAAPLPATAALAMTAYLQLTKPRITLFIVISTAVGFICARRMAEPWIFFHALLGTALLASGTAALNQWYERDADAKMNRTKWRPIPSGRASATGAFWFGTVLSLAGFADLWLGTNRLAAELGIFTLLSYLLAYTPLKRHSPHSTTIGAIPGAMPPLIGFAAAAGRLNVQAWILYCILFLWQFPHFYAIAWMYREDYARGGIRMLPVIEPDCESTARRIACYSFALFAVSLLPGFFGYAGNVYTAGALALGAWFLFTASRTVLSLTRTDARRLLLASIVYLPVLFGLLVLDHARS